MADSGRERRRHPRAALHMLVQYRFDTLEAFLSQYATNISMGGMFIRTDDPNDEGEMVYLQFSLTDGSRLIEGMGRVVRVNPPGSEAPGMGVEFVNFDDDSMALISEICATRLAAHQPKN